MLQESLDIAAKMKSDMQACVDSLNTKIQETQGQMAAVDKLMANYAADGDAREAIGFDKGLAQAGQLNTDGKIYSDAEMTQQIADDKAKADAAVAAVQVQLDASVQAQADLQAKLDAALKAQADAEAKAAGDEAKMAAAKTDLS